MGVNEYRARNTVRAEQLEEGGNHVTANGVSYIPAGDYLVHIPGYGTRRVEKDAFESEYVVITDAEAEVRAYVPEGQTVEKVLEFLRDNPDEVERIKALESVAGKRKGILEYEER